MPFPEIRFTTKCACGCGIEIPKYDSIGRRRRYVIGHGKHKYPEDVIKNNIEINENGCWIWKGYTQKSGHGQLRFRNKAYFAHRFSYELFNGKIKEDKQVNHKCGNSSCVNPEHLYLGTQLDNMNDAVNDGVAIFKRIHNDNKIIEIRKLYENGIKQIDIARKFNVNPSWISRVVRFEKRKNVGGD